MMAPDLIVLEDEKMEYNRRRSGRMRKTRVPNTTANHQSVNSAEITSGKSDTEQVGVKENGINDMEDKGEEKSDENTGPKLSFFEQQRLKNMEQNAKFLNEIDLNSANSVLAPPPPPKTLKSVPSIKRVAARESNGPRRQSARLKNLPVVTSYKEPEPGLSEYVPEPKAPKIVPRVYCGAFHYEDLKRSLKSVLEGRISSTVKTEGNDKVLESLANLRVSESDVAKCCQGRIYDARFHPSIDKLLLATCDKFGCLGLWDIDCEQSESDSDNRRSSGCFLVQPQPHNDNIRCLKFATSDSSKLYTCSYDGTVKCVDLNKCEFSTICKDSDFNVNNRSLKYDFGFHWLDILQDKVSLCIGDQIGNIIIKDPRVSEGYSSFTNGLKPVKCVSAHPLKPYLVASDQLSVKVWDIRNKKTCIADLPHSRVAHGVFFSPISGDKILTTSYDDTIRVFDSSVLAADEVKLNVRYHHNNQTGRWLAPFQALWHPRNEEIFVIGSMDFPRRVDVFTTGNKQKALTMTGNDSICCRNAIHPTLDVVAGTTSSGKAFIWR